ncbi:MAG: glycoside hydrolase [Lachnospiraceae bacterium]
MKLKRYMMSTVLGMLLLFVTACAGQTEEEKNSKTEEITEALKETTPEPTKEAEPTMTPTPAIEYSKVKVNETQTYQTWESFGVSGAWWSQYVGGWDEPYKDNELATREQIARYLYSMDEGIGLTCYRYNLGAGSVEAGNGNFWYPERRAESFETAPGVYDFTKDANAQWFLNRVVELTGGEVDIVLFCNSPLCRLTVNGKAQMTTGSKVNLLPEHYDDFATYVLDVAEYFVSKGIPVTDISPINEPQWDWNDGQEGCHYEPAEAAAVLRTFVDEIAKRESLSGVRISGPESGEWGGKTKDYINAIMRDEVLKDYFDVLDCHSYWTNKSTKEEFKRWMNVRYPDVKLRTSEWVEMVNGTDYTMDSAFNLADEIYDDLTVLDVVSWQYWVGVANGGYRDGLIYVNTSAKACRPAKRLWGYGNFTRFIRPGYTRVAVENPYIDLYNMKSVAFTGKNGEDREQLVLVFINREEEKTFQLALSETGKYTEYEVYTTNETHDLERTEQGAYVENQAITIQGESIVTIILTK